MAMLDEAHHWAETQFGAAKLGDARRTGRLVSTMAAIARAPDESLPRQLGSIADAKAAYQLFDCGAVTQEAVMDPHLAHQTIWARPPKGVTRQTRESAVGRHGRDDRPSAGG
jgi:hypothetical protein